MLVHNILRQYKGTDGIAIALAEAVSGNAEMNLDDAALAVVANHQYHIAITRANLQSLCFQASGPVTVYTNAISSGSPTDTIPLTTGQTLIWTLAADTITKCPFSADVTTIYVTNAGSGPVTFKMRAVVNQ